MPDRDGKHAHAVHQICTELCLVAKRRLLEHGSGAPVPYLGPPNRDKDLLVLDRIGAWLDGRGVWPMPGATLSLHEFYGHVTRLPDLTSPDAAPPLTLRDALEPIRKAACNLAASPLPKTASTPQVLLRLAGKAGALVLSAAVGHVVGLACDGLLPVHPQEAGSISYYSIVVVQQEAQATTRRSTTGALRGACGGKLGRSSATARGHRSRTRRRTQPGRRRPTVLRSLTSGPQRQAPQRALEGGESTPARHQERGAA